jgi:hypothetical protein
MIVRILGEGQLEVPEAEMDGLNHLDAELQGAVDAGDEDRFRSTLARLLDQVRSAGQPLPDDELKPSELVLPAAEADLDEVRELLGDEGLIPG